MLTCCVLSLPTQFIDETAVTHEHCQDVTDSAGAYHYVPVCEHGVEPLVLELLVEVGTDVSLGVEHLQTHAAKHAMKPWHEKQQLLYKPVWTRGVSIHFEQKGH